MTEPKRPRGRPPNPVSSVPAIDDGLENRLRALVARTADVAEKRLDEYERVTDPSPEMTASIMKTGVECGVLLGHIRRHSDSVRSAGRKLSLPIVLTWAREQSPEVVAKIIGELTGGEPGGSVLG